MKIAVLSTRSDLFLVEGVKVFRELVLGAASEVEDGLDWWATVLVEFLWKGFLDVIETDIVQR